MNKEIALATGVLVVTAFAGAAVLLLGTRNAAEVIWGAGVLLSVLIALTAPWLLHFLHDDDSGD